MLLRSRPFRVSQAAFLLLLATLWLLSASLGRDRAESHAFLERSLPLGGTELDLIPGEVCLWFNQAIEKAFSTITVIDAQGMRVDDLEAETEAEEESTSRFSLAAPGTSDRIAIPLKPLVPGSYTAVWKVLSIDSHVVEGSFSFTVLDGAEPEPDPVPDDETGQEDVERFCGEPPADED